jgi:acyl-CoA reductase-like NAD-dependent aldehyde dehydrogenase
MKAPGYILPLSIVFRINTATIRECKAAVKALRHREEKSPFKRVSAFERAFIIYNISGLLQRCCRIRLIAYKFTVGG